MQENFRVSVDLNQISTTPHMNQDCAAGMSSVNGTTRMMSQNLRAAELPVSHPAFFCLGESSMSQLAMPVSIERVNEKQLMERDNHNINNAITNLDDEVNSSSAIVAF